MKVLFTADLRTLWVFFLLFILTDLQGYGQGKIKLVSNHPDARFSKIDDADMAKFTALGEGEISFKLDKNSQNKLLVTKEGYEPVYLEFPKSEKYEKELSILLLNRMVEVESNHADAAVMVGNKVHGNGLSKIIIPQGETVEVSINKPGYVPLRAVYYNSPDMEIPPVKQFFELKDRFVQLDVLPGEVRYFLDGQELQGKVTGITVPYDKCVELKLVKDGYADVTQNYCNMTGSEVYPPILQKFKMEDRVVKFDIQPADAAISINGAAQGYGQYALLVPKGRCMKVEVIREGYMSFVQTYCNQNENDKLPVVESLALTEDQAYQASVYTDKVNHRIPLTIRKSMSSPDAWKILISIITRSFDVLETVDFNAGYLITSWQYDTFNKGAKTIRSRIIVTNSGSTTENNYAVKFVSQYGEGEPIDIEDSKYVDWNRLLKKYHELLEDMEIRLQ